MIDPNPYAAPVFLTAVAYAVMAWIVYATRPHGRQNRRLAVWMALWAATFVGVAAVFAADDATSAYAWSVTFTAFWTATLLAHLRFVATFDTPLVAPFRGRVADAVLVGAAFLLPLYWILGPERVVERIVPFPPYTAYRAVFAPEWETWARFWTFAMGFVVVATVHAFLRAPRGTPARKQLAAYAAGAVAHDVIFASGLYGLRLHLNDLIREGIAPPAWEVKVSLLYHAVAGACFLVALSYGILRTQLFDIDLKIKWTLRRGTLVAVFVGVFFVVAEAVQNFLADEYGWLLGGVAAGALLLAIRPLEGAANRVADAAMPHVRDDHEYVAFRKLEVYKGAVEEMLSDGALTEKDRTVLAGLRRRLGIADGAAAAVERDVGAARGTA
ncbi:MAG: hypothetical protein ACT4PT_08670 [Methanobacteriota archaeon]